jgi:quinol monooxygenase YgiN
MLVIAARYLTQEGQEATVASILTEMAAISNSDAEPGCVLYTVNQSTEDPRVFLLYEQYVDQAAIDAHTQSEAFKEHVLGRVVPLLERREREYFHVVATGG